VCANFWEVRKLIEVIFRAVKLYMVINIHRVCNFC